MLKLDFYFETLEKKYFNFYYLSSLKNKIDIVNNFLYYKMK